MEILLVDDLMSLARSPHDKPCTTIYLNLGFTPEEHSFGRVRVQTLLKKADEALARSPGRSSAKGGTPSLSSLVDASLNHTPWYAAGAVFFFSENRSGVFFAKHAVEDHYSVSDSFHLKPLLDTMHGLSDYNVIALNRHLVRFFEGNSARVFPRGSVRSIRSHSHFKSERPMEDADEFLRRAGNDFLRLVNKPERPLVLIGSPSLRRRFRALCRIPNSVVEEISATLAFVDSREVHRRTWPAIEQEFNRRKKAMASLLSDDGALMCEDLSVIAKASVEGRVSELLVNRDRSVFGRLDRVSGSLDVYSKESCPFGDDVLCDISQEVMQHGGKAILLPPTKMPGAALAAATFRW